MQELLTRTEDATIIIALCAFGISIVSTGFVAWAAFAQRKHMRMSVLPIAAVQASDFENSVGVSLQNAGLGPMRIRALRVTDAEDVTHNDIITHMPPLEPGILWSYLYDSVDGYALEAGKCFQLLVLKGDPKDQAYRRSRDAVRRKLSTLVVRVEYDDLYGQSMEALEKRLSWFGRNDIER